MNKLKNLETILNLGNYICKNLDLDKQANFSLEFKKLVNSQSDFNRIIIKFIYWLLTDETDGILRHMDFKEITAELGGFYQKALIEKSTLNEWKTRNNKIELAMKATEVLWAAEIPIYISVISRDVASVVGMTEDGEKEHFIKQSEKLIYLLKEKQ